MALVPIVLLLILLPVLRMSAWQAVIIGAVVSFAARLLLRWWRPKETLGFGGVPVEEEKINLDRTGGGASPGATAPGPSAAGSQVAQVSSPAGAT